MNPSVKEEDILAFNKSRKNIFLAKSDISLSPDIISDLINKNLPLDHLNGLDAINIINRIYPNQSWNEFKVSRTGTFHKLFFLQSNTNTKYVIRVNRLSNMTIDLAMHSDDLLQTVLQEQNIFTPNVFLTDCSRRYYPFDYQIQSYVDGINITEYDNEDELIIPKLELLADEMNKIHLISGLGYGPLKIKENTGENQVDIVGVHSNWMDYLKTNLNDHLNLCLSLAAISESEFRFISDIFDINIEVDSRLLHADLGNHNLFYCRNNRIGIIDWEDSILGDPIFDLAMLASFHPERRWFIFINNYLTVSKLTFFQKMDSREFSFRFWVYFLRISLFKTVVRYRFQINDNLNRPKASLRIQRSISAILNNEVLDLKS
jgi:aminoglycoside phosphotransferase (APT) family kinase protein